MGVASPATLISRTGMRNPARARVRQDPLVATAIAVSVASTIFLQPRFGPEMRPVDLFLILAILTTMVLTPRRIRVPASMLIGFALLAGIGTLGTLWSGDSRPLVTFVKTLLVWLWGMCVLGVAQAPGGKRLIVRAFAIGATVGAITIILRKHGFGFGPLEPLIAANRYRPAGVYCNPNVAASHLLVGILLIPLLFRRSAITLGWVAAWLLVLRAMWLTQSLAGLGAFVIAMVMFLPVAAITGRFAAKKWLMAAAFFVLLATSWRIYPILVAGSLQDAGSGHTDRVGRIGAKLENRTRLAGNSLTIWRTSPLVGVGRGRVKEVGFDMGIGLGGAHNEYLTTLAEAGLLGVIGLGLLLGAPLVRGIRALRSGHPETALAAVCLCAMVAHCFFGITHDIIHFRHLWALIALLLALGPALGDRNGRPAAKAREGGQEGGSHNTK